MGINIKSSSNVTTDSSVVTQHEAAPSQNSKTDSNQELPFATGIASIATDVSEAFAKIAPKSTNMANPFKNITLPNLNSVAGSAKKEITAFEMATEAGIKHLLGDVKAFGQNATTQVHTQEVSLSALTDSAIESGVKNIAQDFFAMFKNATK